VQKGQDHQTPMAGKRSAAIVPWLPRKDSNLDKKLQRLPCYRYTTRQLMRAESCQHPGVCAKKISGPRRALALGGHVAKRGSRIVPHHAGTLIKSGKNFPSISNNHLTPPTSNDKTTAYIARPLFPRAARFPSSPHLVSHIISS
jgi:hypothetical protein